jgi:hypothetical protein
MVKRRVDQNGKGGGAEGQSSRIKLKPAVNVLNSFYQMGPWLYGGVAYGIHQGNNEYPVGTIHDEYTPAASLPGMGINVVTQ